jgi:hypothetical protein
MKNLQLDPEFESRVERAAQTLGVSRAELIQDAVAKRCDEVLGTSLAERPAPFIGRIQSSGGRARRTGAAFRQILSRKRAR